MTPDIFADPVVVWVGPIPITRAMLTSTAVTAGLVALAIVSAQAVRVRPRTPTAAATRIVLTFLRDLVADAAGRPSPWLETFAGTLFLFIAACAVAGQLPGVRTPTSNLALASALAVIVFFAVPVAGIRSRGVWAYARHYVSPNPLLFPLHVVSELSRTAALALRLFGNMMSGHLVVALILALVGPFVPVPLMALDLMIGLLQAYIFTILASVYIGASMRVTEGEGK